MSANSFSNECPGGIKEQTPETIPPGWQSDYDYNSSPLNYLERKYQEATVKGVRLYVYFFTDSSRGSVGCKKMRSAFSRSERVRNTLENSLIVMIEYQQFNCLLSKALGRPVDFVRSAPVLVRVLEGTTFGEVFNPTARVGDEGPKLSTFGTSASLARALERFYRNGE